MSTSDYCFKKHTSIVKIPSQEASEMIRSVICLLAQPVDLSSYIQHPQSDRSILQPWEGCTETEGPKALLASQPNQNSEFEVIKGPCLKKVGSNKGRGQMLLSSLYTQTHTCAHKLICTQHPHTHKNCILTS